MRARWLIPLGLVALTWLVLGQVVLFDFVDYDDPLYVTDNPHVMGGLEPANVRWALTTDRDLSWSPLMWISLMVDAEVFGVDPQGFHLTNLILHTLNVLLLYAVLLTLTQQIGPAAFVAALFAVHPLHVEVAAWVSERKELLAATFGLAALWAYARYADSGRWIWYTLALVAFAASLLSKQMWVTLPFVLLLLDYWPLRRVASKADVTKVTAHDAPNGPSGSPRRKRGARMGTGTTISTQPAEIKRDPVRSLIWEKWPFFLLTILFCVAAFVAQTRGGSVRSLSQLSLQSRVLNAVTVYGIYIRKTFWPSDLAFFYRHPDEAVSLGGAGASLVVLLAITAWAGYEWRRRPFLIVGWLWYLGTLVPVIGFVQIGRQQMADRYTYLPSIGLSIAVVWGACSLVPAGRFRPAILGTLGCLILVPMMWLGWRQASYWRDSIALFSHALDVTTDNAVAHSGLAVALQAGRRLDESEFHHREAVRIEPDQATFHYNLAALLVEQGRSDEAIDEFQTAIELQPDSPLPYYQLGSLYYRQGDTQRAVELLRATIDVDPDFAEAHRSLGRLLDELGDHEQATRHLQEAARIDGNSGSTGSRP